MFKTPALDFIATREINEENEDPLLDIDALLIDDNWELLKRSANHAVYRKAETDYDIIDISHKTTTSGEHSFFVSLPLITTRYAYSTHIYGSKQMFEYLCEFVEHYSQEKGGNTFASRL